MTTRRSCPAPHTFRMRKVRLGHRSKPPQPVPPTTGRMRRVTSKLAKVELRQVDSYSDLDEPFPRKHASCSNFYVPGILMPLVIRHSRGLRLLPVILLAFLVVSGTSAVLAHGGHDCDRKGCDLGVMVAYCAIAFSLASGAISCVLPTCGALWARTRCERRLSHESRP